MNFDITKIIYYKVFSEVASSSSFSKAAESLSMSPSLVTKNINKLEDYLEIKLFKRNTRQVELTPAGSALFESIPQILNELESAVNAAAKIQFDEIHTLKIGAMNTADWDKFLFPFLDMNKFKEDNPSVKIELISDYMTTLPDLLANNQLDVIIIPDFLTPPVEKTSAEWQVWSEDNSTVTIPLSNPLSKKKVITLEELKDETFNMLDIPSFLSYIKEIFKPYTDNLKVRKKYINAYTLHNTYTPEDNSVLFTDAYVSDPNSTVPFVRIPVSDHKSGTIAVWKKNNKLACEFMEWFNRSR